MIWCPTVVFLKERINAGESAEVIFVFTDAEITQLRFAVFLLCNKANAVTIFNFYIASFAKRLIIVGSGNRKVRIVCILSKKNSYTA